MADQSSTAHLYSSVTKLAYIEVQQAIQPTPPFAIADRNDLAQQAKQVAECATMFMQKASASVSQTQLFEAQSSVNTAQTMFDILNNTSIHRPTKNDVYSSVRNAVAAVNSL